MCRLSLTEPFDLDASSCTVYRHDIIKHAGEHNERYFLSLSFL